LPHTEHSEKLAINKCYTNTRLQFPAPSAERFGRAQSQQLLDWTRRPICHHMQALWTHGLSWRHVWWYQAELHADKNAEFYYLSIQYWCQFTRPKCQGCKINAL